MANIKLSQIVPAAPGGITDQIVGVKGGNVDALYSIEQVLDTFGNVQGDVLYRDSSQWKVLAPGTSGQFLQTTGASANPSWKAAPSLTVFSVVNYGATGNGVTDDTTAINAAIAAFNAKGSGVLYFPAGSYLVTASLTTITAVGIVRGEGSANYNNLSSGSPFVTATAINCNSTSAVVFSVNSGTLSFYDLAIVNTVQTTQTVLSTSKGITATFATLAPAVNFFNLTVSGFYIGIDIQVGNAWVMSNCIILNQAQYGVSIQNTVNTDAGDWSINNCSFWANAVGFNGTPAAAIFQRGSGGGKIANCKFNCDTAFGWNYCIDSNLSGTSDLAISNISAENYATSFIKGASLSNVTMDNIQMLHSANIGNPPFMDFTACEFMTISNIIGESGTGSFIFKFDAGGATGIVITNIVCTNLTKGVIDPASGPVNFAESGVFRVNAPVANSTVTLATATGLSAVLYGANSSGLKFIYEFEAYLPFTDAAAGGIQAAMVGDGTLTISSIIYDGWIIDSGANGIKGNARSAALSGVVASATTTGTSGVVLIKGEVIVTVTGALSVQFAQNTSNGTATTILAGAWFKFWRAPITPGS